MRKPIDLSHLPASAELWALAKLADRFAHAILDSPYDALTGAWKPSDLLPPDDPARTERTAPHRQSAPMGLLGLPLDTIFQGQTDSSVTRSENKRRHRAALQSRFLVELAADATYSKLHMLPEFRALLELFTAVRKEPKRNDALRSPDAEARYISAVARSLAVLRGGRAKAANKRRREQAAHLIDKLLAMRSQGIGPPLIGFVRDADGSRIAWLADELKRWRDNLLAPPRGGSKKRSDKNDPHLGHRRARASFHDDIERAFGSPVLADRLATRFAKLIRYENEYA